LNRSYRDTDWRPVQLRESSQGIGYSFRVSMDLTGRSILFILLVCQQPPRPCGILCRQLITRAF